MSYFHCYSSWRCFLTLYFWLNVVYCGFIIWLFFSFLCHLIKWSWAQTPLKFLIFPCSVNSLGISDELKQKLQDVMVDRHKLTLGKTLGEGTALFCFALLCFLTAVCVSLISGMACSKYAQYQCRLVPEKQKGEKGVGNTFI